MFLGAAEAPSVSVFLCAEVVALPEWTSLGRADSLGTVPGFGMALWGELQEGNMGVHWEFGFGKGQKWKWILTELWGLSISLCPSLSTAFACQTLAVSHMICSSKQRLPELSWQRY